MSDTPPQRNDTDAVWTRAEVESPCIKICVIHPAERICTGCFRTIDEITRWSKMSPEDRSQVMTELPGRAAGLGKRRGGRAARVLRG